jgi:hypothetical protein
MLFGPTGSSRNDYFLETWSPVLVDSYDSNFSTARATICYDDFDQLGRCRHSGQYAGHGGTPESRSPTISPVKLEKRRRNLEPGPTQVDGPLDTAAAYQQDGPICNQRIALDGCGVTGDAWLSQRSDTQSEQAEVTAS